jgi:glycosyltransferase involved in cell wall biosynthesis
MERYSMRFAEVKPGTSNTKPLVSVIMPYYNAEQWLPEALGSLLENDYINTEIIIVDDGSDVPPEVSHRDVTVLRKNNGGSGSARNFGAKHAKGKYLLFCDSDNIFRKDMISAMVRAILISGCDCVSPYLERFGACEPDIWTPLGASAEYGLFANSYGDSNFLINANAFNAMGGFDERLKWFEDWDFLARLTLAGYDYDVIPEPLLKYRVRPDGVNANADLFDGQRHIASLYGEHFKNNPGFWSLFCVDAYNALNIKETEREKAHADAVDELRRAHTSAADERNRAHEAALAEIERAQETARELLTAKGLLRCLKSRLLSRSTM